MYRLGFPAGVRSGRASTALLVAVLLAYANWSAWRYARRLGGRHSAGSRSDSPAGTGSGPGSINPGHLALLGASLAWAAREGISASELGLGPRGVARSLVWGAVVGTLASAAVRVFFQMPLIRDRLVPPGEFRELAGPGLGWAVWGQALVGSALLEEVAFRGLLHAKLVRLVGSARALLVGSAVFAAWHLVIAWFNLRRSGLPAPLLPFLYGGTLAVLFGAGLVFGALRQATGHLAGSVLAHWLIVASIILALARLGRTPEGGPSGR